MASKQAANQRRALRWAQASLCAGCGGHLPSVRKLNRYHADYPTFDHVVPRCDGGGRTLRNGLLKHQRCNHARGNRPPTGCDLVWLALVAARLATRPKSFKPVFAGGAINRGRPPANQHRGRPADSRRQVSGE